MKSARKMKVVLCLLLSLVAMPDFASNVVWGSSSLQYNGTTWDGKDDWYTLDAPFLNLYVSSCEVGMKLMAEAYSYMEFRSSVKVVSAGTDVGPETMAKGPYFYHADFDTTGINNAYSDYDIYMNCYDRIFLATEEESFFSPGNVYYGWVELELGGDGILRLVHSAYDRDGDSIMVDPTPEPSSCLLMVMGIAALGLRRAQRKTGEE